MSLIAVWVIYAIVGTAAFTAAFAWAVRTRQFSDLDRARIIALKSAEPVDGAETRQRTPCRADRTHG